MITQDLINRVIEELNADSAKQLEALLAAIDADNESPDQPTQSESK